MDKLLWLSHELGKEERQLALLAEGNTSARLDDSTFLVKSSGASLERLTETETTKCRFEPVLKLFHAKNLTDQHVEAVLLSSKQDESSRMPSIETLFHAWLLAQPGVAFVGHCHPVSTNQILCSTKAKAFSAGCLFPDQVVVCGPESVFVGYADPGLSLALAIARETKAYIDRWKSAPRVIMLKNHGIICTGASAESVLASTLMIDKAARIFAGAAQIGEPEFLDLEHVQRIHSRIDEKHRQKTLNL